MKRIDTVSKAADLHGAGKDGFTDGGGGVAPTTVDDDWLNNVQEEIANAIEVAGGTLNGANNAQLSDMLEKMRPLSAFCGLSLSAVAGPAVATLTLPSTQPVPDSGFSLQNSDTELVTPDGGLYLVCLHARITCADTTNPLRVWGNVESGLGSFGQTLLFSGVRYSASGSDEIVVSGSGIITSSTYLRVKFSLSGGGSSFSTASSNTSDDYVNFMSVTRLRGA